MFVKEANTNQTTLITNLVRVCELDASFCAEEAKLTWDLGKSLGFYAENDDDVINTLAYSYMEKEDRTKRARAKGKKGRIWGRYLMDPSYRLNALGLSLCPGMFCILFLCSLCPSVFWALS